MVTRFRAVRGKRYDYPFSVLVVEILHFLVIPLFLSAPRKARHFQTRAPCFDANSRSRFECADADDGTSMLLPIAAQTHPRAPNESACRGLDYFRDASEAS